MFNHPIFSVIGIEIEYMIVDRDSLNVQPKNDELIHLLAGYQANEIALGDIAASNELVMHVIELKNNGPKPPKTPIALQFQQAINQLQPILEHHHLQLLPTGAHPWMNPLSETKRWPHGDTSIYEQYNTVFNCQGHGWANLQSMHINLPFSNDEEFDELHNLIRLLLPIMPALAASSPILESKTTGFLDSRLHCYGQNQLKIPSIAGDIIPEVIHSEAEYVQTILEPMYQDISPFDPKGILQHEWLNSRAAIPKFEAMAMEIRLLDTQECVNADIAIALAILAILKSWSAKGQARHLDPSFDTRRLKAIYDQTITDGFNVCIDDKELLEHWQFPRNRSLTLREIWSRLIEEVSHDLDNTTQLALEHILSHGNLSERILKACHHDFSRTKLHQVYRQLGDCLVSNQQFKTS